MTPDIDADPAEMSPDGHTLPIDAYQGGEPLAAGLEVTVGPGLEVWVVLRVDEADGVFHIHRP